MLDLIASTASEKEGDPLIEKLNELFGDDSIQTAIRELRLEIIDRLEGSDVGLEGIDMRSGNGDFLFDDSIRKTLGKARVDLASIGIGTFMGEVTMHDLEGKTVLGQVAIPYNSAWARQTFINTNPLKLVSQFTFTPYRVSVPVWPDEVKKGDTGAAFVFSERQTIVAQILMIVTSVIGYRDLTLSALKESEDDPVYGAPKVQADLADLSAALDYAVLLREQFFELPPYDPERDMTRLMSAAAAERQLPS